VLVPILNPPWGVSLCLNADFRGRTQLLGGVRTLIGELCSRSLQQAEQASLLTMAVQELIENLVKYSDGVDDTMSFELCLLEGQPAARIRTENRATPEHLREATAILSRIVSAADASSLYDEMLAASGEREGSRLGLIRVRAEAGLALSYSVESDRLSVVATGPVEAKMSAP
jgi:hypothetical protein